MKNRHIENNIRFVLDILDYPELVHDNGFILFLDIYKAFDMVEHKCIFQSLDKFGFGNFFTSVIKTLYQNGNSSLKLRNGSSPRFGLCRGIRQGCPVSPYLFLLVAQLLADYIKSGPLKGITLADKVVTLTQLADDTTLFLKDENQISLAIKEISTFSKAYGLSLNLKKCELMAIKNCSLSSIEGIPTRKEVVYLGINITKERKKKKETP